MNQLFHNTIYRPVWFINNEITPFSTIFFIFWRKLCLISLFFVHYSDSAFIFLVKLLLEWLPFAQRFAEIGLFIDGRYKLVMCHTRRE